MFDALQKYNSILLQHNGGVAEQMALGHGVQRRLSGVVSCGAPPRRSRLRDLSAR